MATEYGNGVRSSHKVLGINGTYYKDINDYDTIERAYNSIRNWQRQNGETSHSKDELRKLSSRMQELYPLKQQAEYQAQMAEYQAMMSEYMGAMSEAMNREEPAVEPLKAAQETMNAARNDTARKQLLRRGLMSTMTRYGSPSATRTKLGA